MSLVSVIVPNYNHAPYLRQRLDSIFNQTFQDFEVIILDDCSTDNSKEIIEEYRIRPHVSYIVYNKSNSGSPFKQWAKGFNLAQGKFIWIAESDDWAEKNFLSNMLDIHKDNPNISIAFCHSLWEYENFCIDKPISPTDFCFDGKEFILKWMLYNNFICNASSVLLKKKALESINFDFMSFQCSGDYLLWIKICETGLVAYTNKGLNHFRRHGNATSIQGISSGIQYKENHKIFLYLLQNNYISPWVKQKIVFSYLNLIYSDYANGKMPQTVYNEIISLWESNFLLPKGVFWVKLRKSFL